MSTIVRAYVKFMWQHISDESRMLLCLLAKIPAANTSTIIFCDPT